MVEQRRLGLLLLVLLLMVWLLLVGLMLLKLVAEGHAGVVQGSAVVKGRRVRR